jgi:transcriptional regulator with XRE-family HTH domain
LSTSDFGGKLRQARERRGISLRQIAASTKISTSALEGLERNDVSKLPGGIFSRAFVRSYAVEVGLDPDETVKEFLERFQGEPAAIGLAVVPISAEETRFEQRRRVASVIVKAALIGIPLAAAVLYFTLRSRAAPSETARPGPSSPAASDSAAPPGPPPAPSSAAAPQAMTLELHPTGPCRIALTIDGRKVMDRLMNPGEREVQTVGASVVIEVSDAAAFDYSIDGKPGKPLGSTGGQTATITRATVGDYLR